MVLVVGGRYLRPSLLQVQMQVSWNLIHIHILVAADIDLLISPGIIITSFGVVQRMGGELCGAIIGWGLGLMIIVCGEA